MNVLGVNLEFDFLDADELEVYEKENQKLLNKISEKTQYEGLSTADTLRLQCKIVNDFFDAVFGPGTASAIFKGKNNIREHMEAFGIVSDGARQSGKGLDDLKNKYTPNRADRRSQNKQHKPRPQNYQGNHQRNSI